MSIRSGVAAVCATLLATFVEAGVCVLLGCPSSLPAKSEPLGRRAAPKFSHPTQITNPYLPLSKLRQDVLTGKEDGKVARTVRTRKPGTKTFKLNGRTVDAIIVEDRDYSGGKLQEVTLDYFAQADDGTVYYLGEDVNNIRNGKVVGHEGAWLAGVNGVAPGVIFPAHPKVGAKFRSEDVPGVTTENDEVVSVSETVTVPAGTFRHCVKVREVPSDGEVEYKLYAPNVGVILEKPTGGELKLKSHR